MDVREKLVELLAPTSLNFEQAAYLADYLVKNGVTVQKCGQWVCGDYYDVGDVCSECGWDSQEVYPSYRYCPNCGAKMIPQPPKGE